MGIVYRSESCRRMTRLHNDSRCSNHGAETNTTNSLEHASMHRPTPGTSSFPSSSSTAALQFPHVAAGSTVPSNGHAFSPPQSRTPTPSSILSPLPPLPSELFLLALTHLGFRDRLNVRGVAKSWYYFVGKESSLWPSVMPWIDLSYPLNRVITSWAEATSVNAKKPGHGILSMKLAMSVASPVGDNNRHNVVSRYGSVTNTLLSACLPLSNDFNSRGRSTLRRLLLSLPFDSRSCHHIVTDLARNASHPFYASLALIEMDTALNGIIVWGPFFSIWPNAQQITLMGNNRVNPAMQHNWNELSPLRRRNGEWGLVDECRDLRVISFHGLIVHEFMLPDLPRLTVIKLHDVIWEGRQLYQLLRVVRKTLVRLEICDLEFNELVDDRGVADWHANVMTKDPLLVDDYDFEDNVSTGSNEYYETPPPILLSALKYLTVDGELTPPLFISLDTVELATGESVLPTPIFLMPQLVEASLSSMIADLDHLPGSQEGPLTTFGRSAPNVIDFILYNANVSDSLYYCFAAMSAKIEILNLAGTMITDKLVASFTDLLPNLIDVNLTDCSEVSTCGVARFVQLARLSETGREKVSRVQIDPPRWDADTVAWKWLDFVGVLVRAEDDYEGDGPSKDIGSGAAFDQWKKGGKADAQKEQRRRDAERRDHERMKAAEAAAISESKWGFLPGTMGGSSSSLHLGQLPPLPQIIPASHTLPYFPMQAAPALFQYANAQYPPRAQYQIQPAQYQPTVNSMNNVGSEEEETDSEEFEEDEEQGDTPLPVATLPLEQDLTVEDEDYDEDFEDGEEDAFEEVDQHL